VRGKTRLRLLLGGLLALLLAACSGGSGGGSGSGGGGSPAPDFTIDLSDKNLTVRQFNVTHTTLTLTPQHGFSGTVELRLRVRNVPTEFELVPTGLEVAGGSPSNLRLDIYPTTNPPGTYQLTLEARARSGSPLRTVDFTVVVTPP
jgi:hypothetical protein